MGKPKTLRICHKYLVDQDGYDLELQEQARLLAHDYQNYVLFFIPKAEFKAYAIKNRLRKKGGFYYHRLTSSYIIPFFYTKRYGSYSQDLYQPLELLGFSSKFRKILARVNPDIVHIHGTLLPQFLSAAIISKQAGKKVFASHNLGLINQDYSNQNPLILLSKFLIHNLMPLACARVICASNHGRNSFILKSKAVVIAQPPLMLPSAKRPGSAFFQKNNLLKISFSLKRNDQLYFYPSRYCSQKNQLRLVKAFARFAKQYPRSKLVLAGKVGNPSYFEDIRQQALDSGTQHSFCLLPELAPAIIHSIFAISCYAVPVSINEGYGRVAVEAIQHNIPVLAGKGSGYADIVEDGKTGLLVDALDEDSIYQGLVRISSFALEKNLNTKYPDYQAKYLTSLKKLYSAV